MKSLSPQATAIAIATSLSLAACKTLETKANITKAEAERAALSKAPKGKVISSELEKEKGALVWSFDISVPGTKNITEVLVDAKTGKILSAETETPEQQAKEAAAD